MHMAFKAGAIVEFKRLFQHYVDRLGQTFSWSAGFYKPESVDGEKGISLNAKAPKSADVYNPNDRSWLMMWTEMVVRKYSMSGRDPVTERKIVEWLLTSARSLVSSLVTRAEVDAFFVNRCTWMFFFNVPDGSGTIMRELYSRAGVMSLEKDDCPFPVVTAQCVG
jgi:hypothetical protein